MTSPIGGIVRPPEVFDLTRAASYLGLDRHTLRKAVDRIPHQKIGNRYLFHRRALDAWLGAPTPAPTRGTPPDASDHPEAPKPDDDAAREAVLRAALIRA